MRPRQRYAAIGAAATAALLLAACSSSSSGSSSGSSTAAAGSSPILVGVSLPLSGPFAEQGDLMRDAYQLETANWNAKGGINGRKIQLVIYDDKFDPTTAAANVVKMVTQNHVVAMLGTYGSDEAIAASAVAEQYKLPNIQPEAAAPNMTTRGYKYLFNTQTDAHDVQSEIDAYLKADIKPATAALIYDNNPFSIGEADVGLQQLPAQGTKVVANEEITIGEANYTSTVEAVAAKKPDAVLMVVYPDDYVTLVKDFEQINYLPKFLYVQSDLGFDPSGTQALGKAGDYIVGTPDWYNGSPFTSANAFAQQFTAKYGQPGQGEVIKAAQAADILYTGMTTAKSTVGIKIADAISSMNASLIGGQVSFYSDGQAKLPVVVAQLQHLKGVQLYPAATGDGTFVSPPPWSDSSR
jgi:branched-chain amino acid transport system substrate-binding protein